MEKLSRDIGNDILDSLMSIEQVVPDEGLDEPMQSGDTESGGF